MIQTQSLLSVADNSGAKIVMCIKVLGGSKKKTANIGDIIKITVKNVINKSKVKVGEVLKALIVRTKKGILRNDGSYIRFDKNACVLLNDTTEIPIGTRIFGSLPREIKSEKFMKLISLAPEVI